MSKEIAVISCGGTIAMSPESDGGALAPKFTGEQLVERVPGLEKMDATFDVIDLFNKDSTNVGPRDWPLVIDAISDAHSKYDAIVVTHGTDTMANTATATALAFGQELAIPVVFTGSQLPISKLRTDAVVNVESAAQVALEAAEQGISEAMLIFQHKVLRAARAVKINESNFDAFESPAFPHLADLTSEDEIIFSPIARRNSNAGFRPKPHRNFDLGVFVVDADASTNPAIVRAASLSPECTALILRSVGSGNVPDEGESSFVPVIEETLKAGKPVIITSRFVGGQTKPHKYAPGKRALEAGAGHTGNMTDVAAKVKLMLLMGEGVRDLEKVNRNMLIPIAGEVGPTNPR